MRMNSGLGENLEGLHQDYQRSAPQSAQKGVPAALLKPVREENLEDRRFALHDHEPEGKRSAPESAATGKNRRYRRHLYQLFCRLRRTEDCASSVGWTHDLGHLDNLLGNTEIKRCEKVHQLFHHLRHNVVKQRDQRHRVDDLLHGALLNRSCGSTSSNGAGRPAAGASPTSSPASIVKCWAPADWGGMFRNLAVSCNSFPPPGPCHSLSPWS